MKNPLATYLHDHLAGATFAVELLEALRDQHATEPLGQFASGLLIEVESDRDVLQRLAKDLDPRSNVLKEAASWLSEKASRLKLRRHAEGTLGTFETVEALALGILGKEALWAVLATIHEQHRCFGNVDFSKLVADAREQHSRVEAWRINLASTTFALPQGEAPAESHRAES